jgi:RecA/RadA recombinase
MSKRDVAEIRKSLGHKHKKRVLLASDYLSSGSTLLNLAASGRTYGFFVKGHYYFFVGDSTSGKTFLVLTCLAEACQSEDFDGYDLVYNGTTERGAMMNIRKFFGKRLEKRLKTVYSDTIEHMYYDLDDRLERGKPLIYIVDSMDGLNSEDDTEKFKQRKEAHRKGKQIAGSYGDGKAKKNSQDLRKMLTRLFNSGSILIVIGQTRDNLGFGHSKKTRAGGRALKFYAALEMWSSIYKRIKKYYRGKDREQGIIAQVELKKNRLSGKDRTVNVHIYHSYGIDDIGSMVDYLLEEKHWRGKKGKIDAFDLEYKGYREGLIKHIEEENLERELKAIVKRTWEEIEDAVSLKRKRRYE